MSERLPPESSTSWPRSSGWTRGDPVARLGDPEPLDGQDLFAVGRALALADHADGVVARLALVPAITS